MRTAFRGPRELLDFLGLAHDKKFKAHNFKTLVTRSFAKRMQKNYEDPLLLQVLPDSREDEHTEGFVKDPLNEFSGELNSTPNLLKKYRHRALLIASNACAINCRYCFRRHFPYQNNRPNNTNQAISEIATDPSITEVILSGGDPLLIDDKNFSALLRAIEDIDHVKTIRVHTRIPIVLPSRVTEALVESLMKIRKNLVFVVHSNHPKELNWETQRAFNCLKNAGAWLLNQSVLLKGINDSAETQTELAITLFNQGVLPYYLHLPDQVEGTSHFFVDTKKAKKIYKAMQSQLPGYLLPTLVKEIPGKTSKTIITA